MSNSMEGTLTVGIVLGLMLMTFIATSLLKIAASLVTITRVIGN